MVHNERSVCCLIENGKYLIQCGRRVSDIELPPGTIKFEKLEKCNKNEGPKQDSQNRLRSPRLEGREP